MWTIKDSYRLGDDIQSKMLAFALSAEIERNLISQRTKEALAREKAEGVVLGRPKGRKSDKVKLSGKEDIIKDLREHEELLDHLDLLVDGKLKRAAVMLFYKKPGRIISGCYVKIGKFGKGSDLQYQDTVEGSLFRIADQVIDLIYTKYLKAAITYEHDVRVETYPFPREGVREVIYNALGHNNYAASVPIQIRIEDDAMYISNNCILPRGWTVETLIGTHKSIPFNPSIANAFYRAGYIEAWGRGIQKVLESCRELGSSAPEYTVLGDDLTVKFTALASAVIPNGHNDQKNVQKDDRKENETEQRILDMIATQQDISMSAMADQMGISYKTVQRAINHLKENGRIRRNGGKRFGYWEIIEKQ